MAMETSCIIICRWEHQHLSHQLTIDNTKNIIISIMNGIELGYNLTYPSSIELLEKMFISWPTGLTCLRKYSHVAPTDHLGNKQKRYTLADRGSRRLGPQSSRPGPQSLGPRSPLCRGRVANWAPGPWSPGPQSPRTTWEPRPTYCKQERLHMSEHEKRNISVKLYVQTMSFVRCKTPKKTLNLMH